MSGYARCACRDCIEIAIGDLGDLCIQCEDAGCEVDGGDCQLDETYMAWFEGEGN